MQQRGQQEVSQQEREPEALSKVPLVPDSKASRAFFRLYILMTALSAAFSVAAWLLTPFLGLVPAMSFLFCAMVMLTYYVRFKYRFGQKHYKEWFDQMDWDHSVGPFAIGWGIALLVPFASYYGSLGLLVPALFLYATSILKSLVSGSTYLARARDSWKTEGWGVRFVALLFAIALTMAFLIYKILEGGISHLNAVHFLAYGVAAIAYVSTFAGLIYRIVNSIINKEKPALERYLVLGVGLVAAVFAFMIAGMVVGGVSFGFDFLSLIKVTGLMTDTGKWQVFVFFVPSFVATCMSCMDYFSKSLVHLFSKKKEGDQDNPALENEKDGPQSRSDLGEKKTSWREELTDYLEDKKHEYSASLTGLGVGMLLSGGLIALMVIYPALFPEVLAAPGLGGKILLGFMVSTSTSNLYGKIKKTWDGLRGSSIPEAPPVPDVVGGYNMIPQNEPELAEPTEVVTPDLVNTAEERLRPASTSDFFRRVSAAEEKSPSRCASICAIS